MAFIFTSAADGTATNHHQPLLVTGDDPILADALQLTLRGTPDDEAEARHLLASWQANNHEAAEPVAARLAHLLKTHLQERQRLRAALDQERQQRERLQQQLDELMNIEQQLNRRLQVPAVEIPSP